MNSSYFCHPVSLHSRLVILEDRIYSAKLRFYMYLLIVPEYWNEGTLSALVSKKKKKQYNMINCPFQTTYNGSEIISWKKIRVLMKNGN